MPHRHLPGLDGVRGLAIVAVLAKHSFWPSPQNSAFANSILRVCTAGWIGVDLFFVLSGFLITGILLEAREKSHFFRNFYARRAVRVFPLYYGMLTIGLIAAHVRPYWDTKHPDDQMLGHAWWLWTYMTNVRMALHDSWFGFHSGPLNYGHFWSLAVEEHYYFVWPMVVLLCPPKKLLWTALGLAAMSAIARDVFLIHTGHTLTAYSFTPFRCDSLLIGAACAVIAHRPAAVDWLRQRQYWQLAIALLILIGFYPSTNWDYNHELVLTLGVSLLGIIFGLLVLAAAHPAPGPIIRTVSRARWLRGLGKYSYGIYAIHMVVIEVVVGKASAFLQHHVVHSAAISSFAGKSIGIIAAILVAMISFHFYEKPFLRLKKYFAEPGPLDHPGGLRPA